MTISARLDEIIDRVGGFFMGVLLVFLVILLGFTLDRGGAEARTVALCQAHGWPSGSLTWDRTGYCTRRINGTDSIVPVTSILQGER